MAQAQAYVERQHELYASGSGKALREEMLRDENVMLMGEDIGVFNGAFKVTNGLLEEFGEKRVRDTPISENTIVGMGVGGPAIQLASSVMPVLATAWTTVSNTASQSLPGMCSWACSSPPIQ